MKGRLDPQLIEVVDDELVSILRQKTPAERIAMAADCNRAVRFLVATDVERNNPQLTEEQVQAEVARRMLLAAMQPDRGLFR